MELVNTGGASSAAQAVIIGCTSLENPLQYNPGHLLDVLLDHLNLKNDAALTKALEVTPPTISKIRHRRTPVTAMLLVRMHELTGLSIRDLRFLMGDNRPKFDVIPMLRND